MISPRGAVQALFAFANVALLALIVLALIVPTAYVPLKATLLLVSASAVFLLALVGEVKWSNETVVAVLAISAVGALNSLHGLTNGNPGAFRVLTVMSLWPLLYGFLSGLASQAGALEHLTRVLLLSLTLIIFYSLTYLGHALGLVPSYLYVELDQGQGVGFYDGIVEYRLYSVSSLLVLVPFALHYAWNRRSQGTPPYALFFLIAVASVLVVLTGRRAALLVLMLSPALILFSDAVLGVDRRSMFRRVAALIKTLSVCLVGAVTLILALPLMGVEVQPDLIWASFLAGFDFAYGDESVTERTRQFRSLVQNWLHGGILFGVGNGGVVDVIRSQEMPWAYELSYVYLLFTTGLGGVLFYVIWTVWGVARLHRAVQARAELGLYLGPLLSGIAGLAIGAASNPYFTKFDYLWLIMMPHLIAGGLEVTRARERVPH